MSVAGRFTNWKARFDKDCYAGLEEFASRAPNKPYRTSAETEQKVIDLRRTHPNWGKKRIADELAKGNNWVPLVSPHTVRRILKDADLWENVETSAKKRRRSREIEPPKNRYTQSTLTCVLCQPHLKWPISCLR